MGVDSFLDEYISATWENPVYNKERIWNDCAMFVRPATKEGAVILESIRSFMPRKGNGSAALTWLLNLADHHKVSVLLVASRIGRCGLTTRQLIKWYGRHGFVLTSKNGSMRRDWIDTPKEV